MVSGKAAVMAGNTGRQVMTVSEPVGRRLRLIQARLKSEKGRLISYSEVIEMLLDQADELARLRDSPAWLREAGTP